MSLSTNLSPSFMASSVSPSHCVTNSRQLQSREASSRRNHAAAESQLARAARRAPFSSFYDLDSPTVGQPKLSYTTWHRRRLGFSLRLFRNARQRFNQ